MDKKFYCHYDIRTLSIYQISSNNICDDSEYLKSFEIPFSQAQSLLLGQTSTLDWVIDTSDEPFRLIDAKTVKEYNSRVDIYCLNELSEIKNPDIELTMFNNELTVKVINESKIHLRKTNIYITEKNDPSVLLCKIPINITKDSKIQIEKIGKDFSIFTNNKIIKFSLIRM